MISEMTVNTLRSIRAGGWALNVTGAGALAALLLASGPALAQEPGRSGFYFGGHMGYLFGNSTATLASTWPPQNKAFGVSPFR